MKILHVIKGIGHGGASRSLCAITGGLKALGDYQITVASLTPIVEGRELFEEKGLRLMDAPSLSSLHDEARHSDIVQVEWWNNPQIHAFLQSRLPPMRLLLWVHVAGDRWPHLLTDRLVEIADFVVLGCPYAAESAPIRQLRPAEQEQKTAVIYSTADFGRLEPFQPRAHEGFNIGYIGTASFKKMHPAFVSMSASIRIPDAKFIICGNGDIDLLRCQAAFSGASSRFDFRGYVHDIKPILESLDVYGYPLCDSPGAELNTQEAMYAGIPPVVFGLGGLQDVVDHGETGLVVGSKSEYVRAVEHLYHHPAERLRLGRNARAHAIREFGGANSAAKLRTVYDRLLKRPKTPRSWKPSAFAIENPLIGEGALQLIESVHDQAEFFLCSASSREITEVIEADEQITGASPREFTALRAYREYYPGDPLLNLWYALAMGKAGGFREAQAAFRKATGLGNFSWRASWYLACSLEESGDSEGAASVVKEVLTAVPDFLPARQLWDRTRSTGILECVNP